MRNSIFNGSKVSRESGAIQRIPFSDHRELLMDILKYGNQVEVIEPLSLRKELVSILTASLDIYKK
jgi:predicted DNA-binding transcriptional regulator YafY